MSLGPVGSGFFVGGASAPMLSSRASGLKPLPRGRRARVHPVPVVGHFRDAVPQIPDAAGAPVYLNIRTGHTDNVRGQKLLVTQVVDSQRINEISAALS